MSECDTNNQRLLFEEYKLELLQYLDLKKQVLFTVQTLIANPQKYHCPNCAQLCKDTLYSDLRSSAEMVSKIQKMQKRESMKAMGLNTHALL